VFIVVHSVHCFDRVSNPTLTPWGPHSGESFDSRRLRSEPRGDIVTLSSGMFGQILPLIPNLKLGFLHNFGPNLRSTLANIDYVLPFSLGAKSVLFGEFHGEYQDFFKRPNALLFTGAGAAVTQTHVTNRIDLSAGRGLSSFSHTEYFHRVKRLLRCLPNLQQMVFVRRRGCGIRRECGRLRHGRFKC
jgi:hypothetical protein